MAEKDSETEKSLAFVHLFVHWPLSVFFLTLFVCLAMTVLLGSTAFENSNPFTEDSTDYDVYDIRSTAYDSFELARKEVIEMREAFEESQIGGGEPTGDGDKIDNKRNETRVRMQENFGDMTYWIFEAETSKGLFSSREEIETMREAEQLFSKNDEFSKYCMLEYDDAQRKSCRNPSSALNMYYASSWNSTVAKFIIEQLTPENTALYNTIALCIEYNMFCNYLPPNTTQDQLSWATNLNTFMQSIIKYWDGNGELNENFHEVTDFAAHLKDIITKQHYVDFFYDKNFTRDNPVSMYSRLLIFWGSPISGIENKNTSNEEMTQQRDEEVKIRKR